MNPAIIATLVAMIPKHLVAELVVILIQQIIDATDTEMDNKLLEPVLDRLQEVLRKGT